MFTLLLVVPSARGQNCPASLSVTYNPDSNHVTGTFNVPVTALFAAWADHGTRRRWLEGVDPVVRTASAPKSMRLKWPDGTIVAVGFTAKGHGKSTVALGHTKLRDRAASGKAKAFWTDRLDALGSLLADASHR